MNLLSPIQYVPKVGPVMAKRLENLNIFTVNDLLFHLPTRYEDYSQIVKIADIKENQIVTVIGNVISAKNIYTKSRKQIQNLTIEDDTGKITATWFNQPFIIKNVKSGDVVALSGKLERFGSKLQILSPNYEKVIEGMPLLSTGKIISIYPETSGVTSKWIRSRIMYLLQLPIFEEYLPKNLIDKYHFPTFKKAFENLHFPLSLINLDFYKKRLAYDELFLIELNSIQTQTLWKKNNIAKEIIIHQDKIQEFIKKLPFTLTSDQQKVTHQILADIGKNSSMNRLLQGDVGSGKTVVAAIAMYAAYLNGYKTYFMAPTEILAEQHYETLTKLMKPFGLKIGLITSSNKLKIENSKLKIDILVGTHSLLEKNVALNNVELIIIDEQHRFGVEQRAILRAKTKNPHVLTMTATPIPRSIALTLYGHLDLSVISEMPKNRHPIKTWVVPNEKRTNAYIWIEKQIRDNDSQAFIICPFIMPSETMTTIKSATEEFKKLQKIFPKLKLALLHGKMTGKMKNEILNSFKNKKIDILVATPIVEVGIDIPNATLMIIEEAQRFGLAQLHQLRGRVGRGSKLSYCLLFSGDGMNTNIARLKYLEKALTGQKLAEIDLQIRGPGEIFGTSQHGYNMLKIASYSDISLIETARGEAINILNESLTLDAFPLLKQRLKSSTISQSTPD